MLAFPRLRLKMAAKAAVLIAGLGIMSVLANWLVLQRLDRLDDLNNVLVNHSGIRSMLQPGEQITTSDNLAPEPLEAQVSWSPEREKYIGILAQLALLEHKISQIPLPGPRYASDLLPRVPADMPLPDALSQLRRDNSHLALVTDGDRSVCAMVALEDLVEDLIGTVRDGMHRA